MLDMQEKTIQLKLYQFVVTPAPLDASQHVGIMNVSAHSAEDAFAYLKPLLNGKSALGLSKYIASPETKEDEDNDDEPMVDYASKTDIEIDRLIKYLINDRGYTVIKKESYGKETTGQSKPAQ